MPSLLTRDRVAHYCVGLLICAVIVQAFALVRDKRIGGDFAVFYAEGQIALKYPHSELYNTELQDKEYASVVGAPISSPFPYAPWFTLPLEFIARLPYLAAFLVWTSLSLFSLFLAYKLLANVIDLPSYWFNVGFLACLAFPPYLFYSLLNGQPTALALLILTSSYVLIQRRHKLLGGIVLSLLTYKPTLLVLIGPMLLLTMQWRVLIGLAIGSTMLALISLGWAGFEGCVGFLKLLSLYSQVLSSPVEVFQTEKYVDVGSALRLLFGPQPAVRLAILLLVFPLLCFIWYRLGDRPLSWSLAIVFGLLLSMYTPIYDCTLLIFAVVLFGIQIVSKWLLVLLYLVPAVSVSIASVTRIQLYTVLLVIFAIILMRAAFNANHSQRS
jgi:Glycosyltransferase family 87